MTTSEVKAEIVNTINDLPESMLPAALDVLKELQQIPAHDLELMSFIKKSFTEDYLLLEKLAQ